MLLDLYCYEGPSCRVIMDTLNVLTPGQHICMTMGLHACQYCTSMHLQWYSR